jgi:hypothetical protein
MSYKATPERLFRKKQRGPAGSIKKAEMLAHPRLSEAIS